MKLTQHLFITDPDAFLRGNYNCFTLMPDDFMKDAWTYCGEIELDFNVATGTLIEEVQAQISEQLGKHTAAISVLENRQAELLSLEHKS